MPFKTVQVFRPEYPLDITPGMDRLAHPDEITRVKLAELITRDELPRYRGDEVTFDRTDTSFTITMLWKSREVAQEYADFCSSSVPSYPDDEEFLISVEVIEY
jgi:hypothetical protein